MGVVGWLLLCGIAVGVTLAGLGAWMLLRNRTPSWLGMAIARDPSAEKHLIWMGCGVIMASVGRLADGAWALVVIVAGAVALAVGIAGYGQGPTHRTPGD